MAEAFRVLKPGGRLGITDDTDPAQLARAEQQAGCLAGALTQPGYAPAARSRIHRRHQHQPGSGSLHSAVIRATKPRTGQPGPFGE